MLSASRHAGGSNGVYTHKAKEERSASLGCISWMNLLIVYYMLLNYMLILKKDFYKINFQITINLKYILVI